MNDRPQHPRQTLSYLRNLFEERGIRPKSKLGQNFLIDLNVLDVMVAAAELTKDGQTAKVVVDEKGKIVDEPKFEAPKEKMKKSAA